MVPSECSFDNKSGQGNKSAMKQPNSIDEIGKAAMRCDLAEYGTLSSQRPVREKKRPKRLPDELLQPSTKKLKKDHEKTNNSKAFEEYEANIPEICSIQEWHGT